MVEKIKMMKKSTLVIFTILVIFLLSICFVSKNAKSVECVADNENHYNMQWNGKGYPEKLSGEEIPLHARIMAIADVFDAVSAKRCYRDAMPIEKCFQIIEEGSGRDFDPKLVEMFMSAKAEIIEYYLENK